jgi:transposase
MLGRKARLFAPVVAVSLEALVPDDHFYRHLQRTLDLSFVRELVQGTYAATGRPSVDPEVFFRLQLVMFFEGIRSERLLMRHAADRLSVRWYLGYDLNEPLPDHSSLTRIRARYGIAVFRRFFEAIVEQCLQAKLVWGRELYVDATKVNANADLDSLVPRFAVEAREAFQAHLAALFAGEQEREADPEPPGPTPATSEGPAAETGEAAPAVSPTLLPVALPAAQREELAQENAARHDWIAEEGRQQREVRGLYQRTADLRISTTDPDATPMRLKGGETHLGYQVHYVVDGGKRRIIVGVLVTPGEVMENQPMLDLLWHVRFRWRLHPRLACGDTKYGTLESIVALEMASIRAYVPLSNWEERHAVWSASHFRVCCPRPINIAAPRERSCTALEQEQALTGGGCIKLRCPSAMRVPSKLSVRPVPRGAACTATRERSIWSGCGPTTRPKPTRKRFASGRCGSNRSSPKPKTGMACDDFGYDGSGG